MSDIIEMNISMPLDGEGFFRRSCPFCQKEFKVLLNQDELGELTQTAVSGFMLETDEEDSEETPEEASQELFCPYCGQQAPKEQWWTNEQLAYIQVYISNIASKLINENLIDPLSRSLSGSQSISFKGEKMEYQEPWISPETDDMEIKELPCCQRKIKIEENWSGTIHCFFCGFPHKAI